MRLFITLSKKTLCVILAALIIALIILGQLFTAKAGGIDGSTNALRVGYIAGLGYSVEETAVSSKEIVIPTEFSDVYSRYNALQETAGFDLLPYRGKAAVVYSYSVSDSEEIVINIIVSDKLIIGGDISSVRIDGEMKALLPK
ncbi:MAG: DUF4830 domain-containing protein [Acutalibacteraceae bacterium]